MVEIETMCAFLEFFLLFFFFLLITEVSKFAVEIDFMCVQCSCYQNLILFEKMFCRFVRVEVCFHQWIKQQVMKN